MAESLQQSGPASEPERSPSHHALTPAAADMLRNNVRSRDTEAVTTEPTTDAAPTQPVKREEPLSPYMINPKYLTDNHQSPGPGLTGYGLTGAESAAPTSVPFQKVTAPDSRQLQTAGSGQRFHDAIAVPMAAERIRRPRMIPVQQDRQMRVDAGRTNHFQQALNTPTRSRKSKSLMATLGLTGLAAGLAAWWASTRRLAVSGVGHLRGASASGWSKITGATGAAWNRITGGRRKTDYSSRTGARRRGIAGVDPKLPIVLPLMAILAVLAVGAMSGTFGNLSIGNGSQANNGNNQVGGRGAGEGNNAAGSGSATDGATDGTSGNATNDGAAGSTTTTGANNQNGTGSSTGTVTTPTTNAQGTAGSTASQGTASTSGTPVPTAADGTPLPVGGRGAGEAAIDPATGRIIDPTTGLPIDPNTGKSTN